MKTIILFIALIPLSTFASIIGISSHPLNQRAKVLSAEMTGYMSQKNEMGMGLRYTQETSRYRIMDFSVAGGQEARAMTVGTGMDFESLSEKINQPRVSLKPYLQYQRFEGTTSNLIGAAPSIRKGFSVQGQEFFPYLAVPSGMKIDSVTDEFVYYASVSFGASMPLPGAQNDKILLTLEGNKNMGASYDYVGCLVSWIWK
jgi:hypothetical protein